MNSPPASSKLRCHLRNVAQLGDIVTKAGLLEITTPKPGNVGPLSRGRESEYELFKEVASRMGDWIQSFLGEIKPPEVPRNNLGELVYRLVDHMVDVSSGQNLLLGHILLFSPLTLASAQILGTPQESNCRQWDSFWKIIQNIIRRAGPKQALLLGKAIRESGAGGLSPTNSSLLNSKYDLLNPNFNENINRGRIGVYDLMKAGAPHDSIGAEYATTFSICRDTYLHWYLPNKSKYSDMWRFILDLYIYLLASYPDSLIRRKYGLERAFAVQKLAKNIVEEGGALTATGQLKIQELDDYLMLGAEKMNPGTTADLAACVILIALLFGIPELIE